jgi:hypothetical protein
MTPSAPPQPRIQHQLNQRVNLPPGLSLIARFSRHPSASVACVCLSLMCASSLVAGVMREQVIELKSGWNAVHLEVDPLATKPQEVFEGMPVDVVARYFRPISPVQFISNPEDEPWKKAGWGVWYVPTRDDSFLTSLHAIQGNNTYLIHATSAHQWKITGKVRFVRRTWYHESFNLVGFTVDSQAPPTFGKFFSGAGGLIGQRIYRLVDGKWAKVTTPAATLMRSGEAFWTYCSGNTDFQGPIDLDVSAIGVMDFGETGSRLSLKWKCNPADASGMAVRVVTPAGAATALPLRHRLRKPDELSDSHPVLGVLNLSGPSGGNEGDLSIQIRREEMSANGREALLKFTDGAGTVAWVPVSASKSQP